MTTPTRDLVGLSRQVLYEFEMVEALAKRLVDLTLGAPRPAWRNRFQTPEPLQRDWFEQNAMIESLLVHVRALTQFFYRPPPAPHRRAGKGKRGKAGWLADAFAEDYFDDPIADWRRHPEGRGRQPDLLKDAELNRISREVAHLTYERAGFVTGGSNWSSYALYSAVADVMERFASRVDPARVLPDFRERVEAAMYPRQPKPGLPGPGGYFTTPGPLRVATQGKPPRRDT